MTTTFSEYSRLLAEQLRLNGMKEPDVREVVAQVWSHVRATGEDPVEAFGQPVEYAAQWEKLSSRRWVIQVLLGAMFALGIVCGVKAFVADTGWGGNVPLRGSDAIRFVMWFCILGLIPWTAGLMESRRRAARWGLPPRSTWPLRIAVALAAGVTFGVVAWAVDEWAREAVLLQVPRWLLVVLSVAGVGAGFIMGPAPNSAAHPVGTPWAPKDGWRTRVRRAFIDR